jgi:hypothetical protein
MSRPLHFVPENALVEITTRTLQGRLLLRPSPELTDIILGVIGKAQKLYGMTKLVNANVATEAGRLHLAHQAHYRRVVAEIQTNAEAENKEKVVSSKPGSLDAGSPRSRKNAGATLGQCFQLTLCPY